MPKPKGAVEDEDKIVDETEGEPTEPVETPPGEVEEETPEEPPPEEVPETSAEEEEVPETPEEPPPEEPPSAGQLADALQRIELLEDENAKLKGQPTGEPRPEGRALGAVQAFLSTVVPKVKDQFLKARPLTVKEDGRVVTDPQAIEAQFDALYTLTDHMLGSVLADQVSPVLDVLAEMTISLKNEFEIRDLRAESQPFKAMEKLVRDELVGKTWKDRRAPGVVKSIYQKFLGVRGNGAKPVERVTGKLPVKAAAALRDISAGSATKPAKPTGAFKLTPEQEKDYDDMVQGGWTGTKEQYYAKWKSRAEKAKAANRPIPKTYRAFA